MLAGRGFGKTRCGAEWIRQEIAAERMGRAALVAPTAADVRDTMVEGPSGILNVYPQDARPHYEPSKRRITWPNGATATTFSADEPDRLRGPQFDGAWADELAVWKASEPQRHPPEAWDMLQFGLRLGNRPRAIVTTTPKPQRVIRDLQKSATTVVTRGSSYDNAANLSPDFYQRVIAPYLGTRLGRQEIYGEVLDDVEGALWTWAMIEGARATTHPDLRRVVVAIDPAVSNTEDSDETGIMVAGQGVDDRYYVLADRSCKLSPDGWARRAVHAYREFQGDRIVAEINNGGEMVRYTLRTIDPTIPFTKKTASRGKMIRAEPIASLYEQGKVSHVGVFPELEDQLTTWEPDSGDSPDRLDALVWALTELSDRTEVRAL